MWTAYHARYRYKEEIRMSQYPDSRNGLAAFPTASSVSITPIATRNEMSGHDAESK